jgi:division protein CdvB (Snf7/Vps24/ESCRT-III family)
MGEFIEPGPKSKSSPRSLKRKLNVEGEVMPKYYVKANEQFPDSAHKWYLFKDGYVLGELWVGPDEAQQIVEDLQKVADDNKRKEVDD